MKALHLDLESRSDLDLTKVGVHRYVESPHTDIWVACYAFDDGPVHTWWPGQDVPFDVCGHIEAGGEVWAHNASFERHLVNAAGVRKHGWPFIYTDQTVCTQAMAYAMALPGSLEKAAAALGVSEQKDMAGQRLMLQYCQPRFIDSQGKITWWNDGEKLQRLADYCAQDVIVERAIAKRMRSLSPKEREIYILDQKINDRGIKVDIPAVKNAIEILTQEKESLNQEIRRVSGDQIATANAVAQIKTYLLYRGVDDVESLAKPDVLDHLGKVHLPEDCRRVLEIRQEAGRASTAKLEPMFHGAGTRDHRIRGCFQFSGAGTRRWAGRRVQLQNLKRSTLSPELADEIIKAIGQGRDATYLDILYGRPFDVIANCIRSFLVSDHGKRLLTADFSAIEARAVAWLAGQETTLAVFREGKDIYKHEASNIFGKRADKINEAERQVGKVAVLALGYQGGVGALQTMARGYGVRLSPAKEALEALATIEQVEKARENFARNGSKHGIEEAEFIASDLVKMFWREKNPCIVKYWQGVEDTALSAVQNPGVGFRIGPPGREVVFRTNGSFLWATLPSGGTICYPYPQSGPVELPWEGRGGKPATKQGLTYMSEELKKWTRVKTYGGKLTENLTQSLARDLLAGSMLKLDKAGFALVAHVHDEIVCEGQPEQFEHMKQIMCEVPAWAEGLPMAAGGKVSGRYCK